MKIDRADGLHMSGWKEILTKYMSIWSAYIRHLMSLSENASFYV